MRLTNCVNGSAFDKWRSEGYKWAMDNRPNIESLAAMAGVFAELDPLEVSHDTRRRAFAEGAAYRWHQCSSKD